MAPTSSPLLLTPEEAALRLGVGRTTLYRLLSTGDLRSVTIGRSRRVSAHALNAYVAALDGHTDARVPPADRAERHSDPLPCTPRRCGPVCHGRRIGGR